MAVPGSPAVARHRLRLALRRRREATGRTQGDIAKSLDWSLSKLQRIEAGENAISTTDLQALLGQLKVTDASVISTLVAEAKVARGRSRWDEPRYRDSLSLAMKMMLDFEEAASVIRSFQSAVFPGILQTAEFAMAVLQMWAHDLSEEQREVRLEVRMERHARVLERLDPPQYMLVLDEAILHRNVGGSEIYGTQLRHLISQARAGRVQLRIAPFHLPAETTVQFPFTVLTMDGNDDSVVYRENYDSDEIIQAPERVQHQLALFDRLWQESLSESASIRLLEDRISELLSFADREPTKQTDR